MKDEEVTRHMLIQDVLQRHPETFAVLEKLGFGCVGCRAALFETAEQGARVHGIDVDLIIANMNAAISKR